MAEDFINALTRGGTPGNPAPIEMRAHDPQIYVTDMLAWINKALLTEKNNLSILLKLCSNSGMYLFLDLNLVSQVYFLIIFVDNTTLMFNVLGNISEGVCQPLKFRIAKILSVPNQVPVLYSMLNLLRYYRKCICKVIYKIKDFKVINL